MLPDRNELAKRYAKLSNDELLQILYEKDDYTAEAMEAVQIEINKRQIGAHELSTFAAEKETINTIAAENALVPLALWEKVLFFFTWFAPWFLVGAFNMNYVEDGLEMKSIQSRFFRIGGFISLFAVGFLSVWLELGNVSGFGLLFLLFGATYWFAPVPDTQSDE